MTNNQAKVHRNKKGQTNNRQKDSKKTNKLVDN